MTEKANPIERLKAARDAADRALQDLVADLADRLDDIGTESAAAADVIGESKLQEQLRMIFNTLPNTAQTLRQQVGLPQPIIAKLGESNDPAT